MGFIRRLLFGDGRFPGDVRAGLEAEGVLFLREGLGGSITYRHYRAPGSRSALRKIGIAGAVAVTRQRLVVWGARHRQIDIPLSDPRLAACEVSAERPDRVMFGLDAEAFSTERSGRIEVRLRGIDAERLVALVKRSG